MPTYEYECASCGYHFELFQSISDKPKETCPKCSKTVKRLIGSGSGIIFKGTGFYATDYRKKPKTPDTPKTDAPAPCSKTKENCDNCPVNKTKNKQ